MKKEDYKDYQDHKVRRHRPPVDLPDHSFRNNWENEARESQKEPPGDWSNWLILAGRGFGKTRTGAETIRKWALSGKYKQIAIIGHTEADAEEIMIRGPSGLLNIHEEDEKPTYYSRRKMLVWPNGAVAYVYSSKAYEKLRGPEFDCAWIDELAKFDYAEEVWDQLMFCLRKGDNPRTIITTTPRPIPIIKELVKNEYGDTHVTRGNSMENEKNLSKRFIANINKYKGTSLWGQEVEGKIIEDNKYSLWNRKQLDKAKVNQLPENMERVIIAVDPATTLGEKADETGIIVCALGKDGKAYIIEDLSGKYSSHEWSSIIIKAYHKYKADRVVAETNQGGNMVEDVLRVVDSTVSYKGVHASRGKVARAEPVAALYEKEEVLHYSQNDLSKLEEQMCSFVPGLTKSILKKSPDRVDALVWGVSELMLRDSETPYIEPYISFT